MSASVVAGYAFPRLGRRGGFWLGCGIMMMGSLTFALGIYTGNFVIYCLGAIPAGLGFGISQHLRFAAAEVADPHARARAISLVLAGGVLAAIVGPEMVKRTNALIPDHVFLATYLYLPLLPVVTAILLSFVQVPPAQKKTGIPVPFRVIFARPDFITAVVSSLVGYGTMNLVMASTPLQMLLCGFGVGASADVIRAHSIAMFLPGFFTGRLIQRFGVHRIIMIGGLLTLGCVAVNLFELPVFWTFVVALALLGVGWNFMFVGGTTLLTTALRAGGAGAGAGDPRFHRVRQRGDDRADLRRGAGDRGVGRAEPDRGAAGADRVRRRGLALAGAVTDGGGPAFGVLKAVCLWSWPPRGQRSATVRVTRPAV